MNQKRCDYCGEFKDQLRATPFLADAGLSMCKECLDITKEAVEDIGEFHSVLEKYNAYILFQVHDELIYDVPADISMEALQEIASVMQNAIPTAPFGVSFKSDIRKHTRPIL